MISCAACTMALARRASSEPERQIGLRRGALDEGERADQRARHALVADAEIVARALGLRAPIAVGRHLDRAERIGFGAVFGAGLSLLPEAVEPHDFGAAAWFRLPSIGLRSPAPALGCGSASGTRHGRFPAGCGSSVLGGVASAAVAARPALRSSRTGSRTAPPDRRTPLPHRTAPRAAPARRRTTGRPRRRRRHRPGPRTDAAGRWSSLPDIARASAPTAARPAPSVSKVILKWCSPGRPFLAASASTVRTTPRKRGLRQNVVADVIDRHVGIRNQWRQSESDDR